MFSLLEQWTTNPLPQVFHLLTAPKFTRFGRTSGLVSLYKKNLNIFCTFLSIYALFEIMRSEYSVVLAQQLAIFYSVSLQRQASFYNSAHNSGFTRLDSIDKSFECLRDFVKGFSNHMITTQNRDKLFFVCGFRRQTCFGR